MEQGRSRALHTIGMAWGRNPRGGVDICGGWGQTMLGVESRAFEGTRKPYRGHGQHLRYNETQREVCTQIAETVRTPQNEEPA
jgi:hypothetical protein